jgi:hypothetical protein
MYELIQNLFLKKTDKRFSVEDKKYCGKIISINDYWFEIVFKLSLFSEPYSFKCILSTQNDKNIIKKLTFGQKKYINNYLDNVIRIKCLDMLYDQESLLIPIEILSDRSIESLLDYKKSKNKFVFYEKNVDSNNSSDSEYEILNSIGD